MNEIQSQKGNRAFILCVVAIVVGLVLLLGLPLLPPVVRPPKQFILFLVYPAVLMPQIFWYKGLYHWFKAKGYHGSLTLLGILGFPLALIVMVLMKDRVPTVPFVQEIVKNCPSCGSLYRLKDYNPQAEHVYCSACKSELPKT